MQFLVANPSWLWLLALGVVPLLVHLFARSNPPKFEFSNTEFLRRIIKKTARMRKPQDWLILLLRTLAILALLAAFLQPLLTSKTSLSGGDQSTIFVIDRSASMAAKVGNTDHFSLACQKAGELLKSGTIDNANVVWMDSVPEAAFPQPGPNLDFLRDLLARAKVHQESGSIASALRIAVTQLEGMKGQRELVIISDFQRSAWEDFQLETPPGIEVVKVRTGDTEQDNLAIKTLLANPSQPVVGQEVSITAQVQNYSGKARRTTLYLESGGARQSQDLNIPAWGQAEANFQTRYAEPGAISMSANIGGDSFPADNSRHFIVQVREALRLVSVSQKESPDSEVLGRLANSLDWLEFQKVRQLPQPGSADFLFVHDWAGLEIAQLKAQQQAGTAVFVQPGSGITHAQIAQLLNTPEKQSGVVGLDQSAAGFKVVISEFANPNEPAFALLQTGEFGDPAGGIFKKRFRLQKDWPTQTRRLLDYTDGVPALLGSGIMLWNLSLASDETTWPSQNAFVPFMGELLLSSLPSGKTGLYVVLPGNFVSWRPDDGLSPESLALIGPDGSVLPTEVQMTEQGPVVKSQDEARPGIYQWKFAEGVVHQLLSNFPSNESDLRTTDPAKIQAGTVVDPSKMLRRAALGDGLPLWPWLIAAALIFLLGESALCLWKPKPSSPK